STDLPKIRKRFSWDRFHFGLVATGNLVWPTLELAVSLGFISVPQHSFPTCPSSLRSLILHTNRNVIIREKAMKYSCRVRGKRAGDTSPIRPRERLGGLLKYYSFLLSDEIPLTPTPRLRQSASARRQVSLKGRGRGEM
ncbi:MAG: hypothetical protein ACE1ZE_01895, partial [Candidatus Binatia bacterium]